MEIRPLRTEADYEAALEAVAPYFDNEPVPETDAADRFELLVMLIEAYENKHYRITPPDPVEAIKFRMEQADLSPKDLMPMIGKSNRVYEVLNYTRALTLPMIRRLNATLGIPAEALISEPKRSRFAIKKNAGKAPVAKLIKHANPGKTAEIKASKSNKLSRRKTSARKTTSLG